MAGLLQFKTLTSATIVETFLLDGTPSDLDGGVGSMPVVTLTRPDGTAGPASGTVTRTGTGVFQFVLAGQPDPTVLDVTWTGTIGGQSQTLTSTVEILGQDLFGLAELRAFKLAGGQPFGTGATPLFTAAQLHDARAVALDELTTILGFSPVPRFAREYHSGDGRSWLFTNQRKPSRLLSVTVDGTAQTVADFDIAETRKLTWSAGSFPGTRARNVVVEYVAGWPRPLGLCGHVAMKMAAAQLLPDGFQTTTTFSTGDATYTYEPAEVASSGFVRHTGVRDLDRWLHRHADTLAYA